MRCIFCKADSGSSKSVEHILPESLGNTEHVLPPGIVCDRCNNYFAREVERPFLESPHIKELRFSAAVTSKKGSIPPVTGVHLQSLTAVQMFQSVDGEPRAVAPLNETDNERWTKSVLNAKRGTLIFPVTSPSNDRVTSRFIAKIGLEVLAQRVESVAGGLEEIIDHKDFEPLRRYARHGDNVREWPVHVRQLYPPDFLFTEHGSSSYEILHEYMIFVTDDSEYYIVVAIFGTEYVLNLGGPELDGYQKWLDKNPGRSPLYLTH